MTGSEGNAGKGLRDSLKLLDRDTRSQDSNGPTTMTGSEGSGGKGLRDSLNFLDRDTRSQNSNGPTTMKGRFNEPLTTDHRPRANSHFFLALSRAALMGASGSVMRMGSRISFISLSSRSLRSRAISVTVRPVLTLSLAISAAARYPIYGLSAAANVRELSSERCGHCCRRRVY
ncbi:MAG: hypothetical protein WA681_12390, partial [Candidatus Acidiferrales bacterium]